MLECLKSNWFQCLLAPSLTIILYAVAFASVLSRKWSRPFPCISLYVGFYLLSFVSLYSVYLLRFTSGEPRRVACLIYDDAYYVVGTIGIGLFFAFVCEFLIRAVKVPVSFVVIPTTITAFLLILVFVASSEALKKGWLQLAYSLSFDSVTLLLAATLAIAVVTYRKGLGLQHRAGVLAWALFIHELVHLFARVSEFVRGKPAYEILSDVAFLVLSAILCWVLRSGPEALTGRDILQRSATA
jgi:hypothetical protein